MPGAYQRCGEVDHLYRRNELAQLSSQEDLLFSGRLSGVHPPSSEVYALSAYELIASQDTSQHSPSVV